MMSTKRESIIYLILLIYAPISTFDVYVITNIDVSGNGRSITPLLGQPIPMILPSQPSSHASNVPLSPAIALATSAAPAPGQASTITSPYYHQYPVWYNGVPLPKSLLHKLLHVTNSDNSVSVASNMVGKRTMSQRSNKNDNLILPLIRNMKQEQQTTHKPTMNSGYVYKDDKTFITNWFNQTLRR